MSICLPYDMEKIYPFFCSRYGNITYNELLNMGYSIIYKPIDSITDIENSNFWEVFKDKAS